MPDKSFLSHSEGTQKRGMHRTLAANKLSQKPTFKCLPVLSVENVERMKCRNRHTGHCYTLRKTRIEVLDFTWLFCRLTNEGIEFPFLTLLVSGGHNLLLLAHSIGRYTQLGTTLDDALGEVRIQDFALEMYRTHVSEC